MARLDNYFRSFRRRSGLTQEDLGFLAGESTSAVSRFELGVRKPTLEYALALEAAYGVSVRELVAGQFHGVARNVAARARVLAKRLDRRIPTRSWERRMEALARIGTPRAQRTA
jgi:transcriptional regulator with XRE-family HTH domain